MDPDGGQAFWNSPYLKRRPVSVPSPADMALARSLRLPIRCHQRMFTSVSPKDVHPVFICPLARRTSGPCTRRGLGELWGGELATGSSGMSQVEGFGDVVTEIEVAWPLMPRATPLMTAADPAATEDASAQSPRLGAKTRDRGWPRWPAAWPDSSLRPRREGRARPTHPHQLDIRAMNPR